MVKKILHADGEMNGDDMHVITPEGNYFNFPAGSYHESHPDETVIDPESHKVYTVKFGE